MRIVFPEEKDSECLKAIVLPVSVPEENSEQHVLDEVEVAQATVATGVAMPERSGTCSDGERVGHIDQPHATGLTSGAKSDATAP